MQRRRGGGGGESGLGRALLRRGSSTSRGRGRGCGTWTVRHTTDELRSVVERNNLDEFMADAEMAKRKFEAERSHAMLLQDGTNIPDEIEKVKFEVGAASVIPIPKRPAWDKTTTPEMLDEAERSSFLAWRRTLATIAEQTELELTPYEKNIEIWRQLWRVIERSDIIAQIVDARNPLLFRCEDLESYVRQVHKKPIILIVNKSDFLSPHMRAVWQENFKKLGVDALFFSALAAQEQASLEERLASVEVADEDPELGDITPLQETIDLPEVDGSIISKYSADIKSDFQDNATPESDVNEIPIYSTSDLISQIMARVDANRSNDEPVMIGLCGYPNVGKSSIINALMGEKRVGVAAMPGKTKHFQTLELNDRVTFCDCPGLVFPSVTRSKADLVCNGVLPLDHLRGSFASSVALVCQRVPAHQFAMIYKLKFPSAYVDPHELMRAYATMRGFMQQNSGLPDERRAARILLKDYTGGKLLFCEPPPHLDDESRTTFFNSLQLTSVALAQRHMERFKPSEAAKLKKQVKDDEEMLKVASVGTTYMDASVAGIVEVDKGRASCGKKKISKKLERARLKAQSRRAAT